VPSERGAGKVLLGNVTGGLDSLELVLLARVELDSLSASVLKKMPCMLATREVFQLSGWLKALA
jgi:hypothetical protein